jgi:hypothetical protein
MAERRGEMFAMMDTDKNGQISRDEFMAHRHEGMPGWRRRGHEHGGNGRWASARWATAIAASTGGGMMAGMADTNKDARSARRTSSPPPTQHFDMTDANKDGQINARTSARRCTRRCASNARHEGRPAGPFRNLGS